MSHNPLIKRIKAFHRLDGWQAPPRLGRYRYRLGWTIDPSGSGRILFVGLNPSTASLTTRDPTVDVFCRGMAQHGGFRELEIVNLFSFRSTDKFALLTADDPVGRRNDDHLIAAFRQADIIVGAWGRSFHEKVRSRAEDVLALFHRTSPVPLMAIKINADGSPSHPLYQPITGRLSPFPFLRYERKRCARSQ